MVKLAYLVFTLLIIYDKQVIGFAVLGGEADGNEKPRSTTQMKPRKLFGSDPEYPFPYGGGEEEPPAPDCVDRECLISHGPLACPSPCTCSPEELCDLLPQPPPPLAQESELYE